MFKFLKKFNKYSVRNIENTPKYSYAQFLDWCNLRAADGLWGPTVASCCIDIIEMVEKEPEYRREWKWADICTDVSVIDAMDKVNKKIRDVYGDSVSLF